jgi:hypothetical protein
MATAQLVRQEFGVYHPANCGVGIQAGIHS